MGFTIQVGLSPIAQSWRRQLITKFQIDDTESLDRLLKAFDSLARTLLQRPGHRYCVSVRVRDSVSGEDFQGQFNFRLPIPAEKGVGGCQTTSLRPRDRPADKLSRRGDYPEKNSG